jgi:hypothetical protein
VKLPLRGVYFSWQSRGNARHAGALSWRVARRCVFPAWACKQDPGRERKF